MTDDRAAQGGNFDLGDRNEGWSASDAQASYDLPADGNCYMWRDPQGDSSTKAAYKLPFVSKSGGKHAVWKAVTAIAALIQGGRGGVDIPQGDIAGIKAKVESYYTKARKKYDDASIEVPWASQSARPTAVVRQGYVPAAYQPEADETVECQDCGKMNPEDAIYCDQCGVKLANPGMLDYAREGDEMIQCPECELWNEADARFCDQCGYKLVGSTDVLMNARPSGDVELRYVVAPLTHVEVRDPSSTDDNTWTMSGYAAVFNERAVLLDSAFAKVTESVDPAFFDRVLREQPMGQSDGVVHFNFGHDMNRAVAATDVPAGQPGSLQLKADAHGLHYLAKVPRDDPDGVAMAVKMRSGVLRQSSFAFSVAADEWVSKENDEGPLEEHRTLLECRHLYDVCATPQGAYPQTVSGLRSYAAALGQPNAAVPVRTATVNEGGRPRQPDEGGVSAVSPETGGSGGDQWDAGARLRVLDETREQRRKLDARRH